MLWPRVNEELTPLPRFSPAAWFEYALLSVAYVVSGKLGLLLALPPGYSSPIFPPAGIAVAAALIGGRKTLPWIFLGSLLLNIWVGYSASQQINSLGLTVAIIIAIASTLQAGIGGWGLRRMIGYPTPLDHSGEVLHFLLLAPLICLTSASLSVSGLMALGIVQSASFASNWAAWWIGDTLGVIVMLPLVMIVAGEPRALWQTRKRTVAIPMLLTFTLFVMIFLKANQWEYTDSLTEFRQLSQQAVNQIQNKLGEQEAVLEETAALFMHDANGRVTREEFHRFVEKSLLRFPMIQALEWASPVNSADRAAFEASQRKDFPNFEIRERNTAGQLQRAGERASYYPVIYIEPLPGNEPALGFDLSSTPERKAALTQTLQEGAAAITPAMRLVQEHEQQAGVLLLLAVNTHKIESGTVLTILRLGDFMDKLLRDTRPMLYTRLVDLEQQKIIYDNFESGNQHALYEHTFSFGTRLYRLEAAPTPAYLLQHHGWQSWSVLAVGILGTGLLGALFLLGTGYTARIEAQVANRTRELKESESRFSNILEHAPIGMATTTLDGHFILVNQAFCSMLGYERNELEKLTFMDVTHTEDNAVTLADRQKLLEGKIETYQKEKRYLRQDGRVVWGLISSSLERNDFGDPLFFIAQIEDITDRKQAEHALQSESEKNLAFLHNASDGIHILDTDGKVIEASDSFCAMLGYPYDEMVGMNVSRWDAKFTDEELTEVLGQLFAKKDRSQFETRHRRKDGSILDVEVSSFPLELYDKPVLFCSSRDITERKKTELALRESEDRFRSISENDLVGIFISKNRIILWSNPAFEKILGYEKGELNGSAARQLYPSDEAYLAFGERAYPVIRSGKVFRTATEQRRKDGCPVFVDVSGGILKPETGETIWSCIDITDRIENEQELQRSNAELEQFSYAISHDMRQPLRMISSYLQLIKMNLAENLDKTNREYFNFAIDGAKRLDQMLLGLLDYSRVGRKSDPYSWIESRALLDEALLFLGPAIAEAQGSLEIEGEWPRVWVSRDEIVRLLRNLVGNAVKYRVAERTPQIRIVSKVAGKLWRVSVSDNGIGINASQIGRLFQVFQRLHSRASYEGNGIGLALCRRIIEHHGGHIWAESAGKNQGSRFCFELTQEHKE